MATALQLPVEFVEREVAKQWRKRASLRSPHHARTNQPVLHHPGIWIFCCLSSLRLMAYWPLLLVRAFGLRSRLGLSIAPPFGFRSASHYPACERSAIRPNSTQPLAPRSAAHMPCRTHSEYQNKVEATYAPLPRPPQTPATPLSGRRWRAWSPSRWPPSAAQTVRAVFPHTAFTKMHAFEAQS